jgi:hypothetical protein
MDRVPQALTNFFSTDNLTALRELALRFLADETDDQLLERLPPGPGRGGCRTALTRPAPPRPAGQRGARPSRMASRWPSAAAIHGRRSGSGTASAHSRSAVVSP